MFVDHQTSFAVPVYGPKRQKNGKLTLHGTSRKLRHESSSQITFLDFFYQFYLYFFLVKELKLTLRN